jgi:hypothetical protein
MSKPTITCVDAVLGCASALRYVHEADANRGRFVDGINQSAGARFGDPWCASFVYYAGSNALGSARWPLPRTPACDELLKHARRTGTLRDLPAKGSVFLVLNPKNPDDAVHTGFVQIAFERGAFRSIEGNSNDDGSREGVAVVSNLRGQIGDTRRYVFIDWESLCK